MTDQSAVRAACEYLLEREKAEAILGQRPLSGPDRAAIDSGIVLANYLASVAPAPASPATGERIIRPSPRSCERFDVFEAFDSNGFAKIVAEDLSQADADLLATGHARIAALERAIRDMLPMACCTCPKSPHGCVVPSATCPFCRARAALSK